MTETERPHPTPDDVPSTDDLDPERHSEEDEGPDVDELDEDPAYNPDDPGLKGLKGG